MAGEMPAARLGDTHTCPAVIGQVLHVGGSITTGSPNVMIGGMPAARVTDLATCVGSPNLIVLGSSSVFINGLPVARIGDQTAHGGVIVSGFRSVMIGNAGGAAGGGASAGADTEFGMAVNVAAQVDVLRHGAASGKAFCKVCQS